MTHRPFHDHATVAIPPAQLSAALPSNNALTRLAILDVRSESHFIDTTADRLVAYPRVSEGRATLKTVFSGRIDRRSSLIMKWFRSLSLVARLWMESGRLDVAVIFVADLTSVLLVLFPSLVAGGVYQVRVIAHVSGELLTCPTAWRRALLKAVLHRATKVISESDREAMILARWGLVSDVIPPALPIAGPRSAEPIQPSIVYHVQSREEIEVARVIGAFVIVKQKYPRAELSIAVPTRLYRNISTIIDGESRSAAHAVSLVDENRWDELLSRGDICICSGCDLPASTDLLRAWQYGIPVLAPRFSDAATRIRDRESGLVFSTIHRSSLADRIFEVIENPAFSSKLAANGVAESVRYTWDAVEPKWRSVLGAVTPT